VSELNAAVKLCECGCGQPTRIAPRNDPRHGHVKGQGVRFLKAHHHRGKIVSAETRAKLAVAGMGENNYGWKGDEVGYRQLHAYLCKYYPKSGVCDECGRPAKRTEYALIHGRAYTRIRSDYRELCAPCHVRYDLGGRQLSAEHVAKLSKAMRKRSARKLSEAAVTEIRRRHAAGESARTLGAEYGVSRQTITGATSRRTWVDVP
jgi:hypothetical protein